MSERTTSADSLESVRRDLAEIDRAIVLLVAARVETAGEAIRLRSQAESSVANPAQEARVVARAREWAGQLGVSPPVVEAIFRTMMEYGKERFCERNLGATSTATRPAPVRSNRSQGHRSVRGMVRPAVVPSA